MAITPRIFLAVFLGACGKRLHLIPRGPLPVRPSPRLQATSAHAPLIKPADVRGLTGSTAREPEGAGGRLTHLVRQRAEPPPAEPLHGRFKSALAMGHPTVHGGRGRSSVISQALVSETSSLDSQKLYLTLWVEDVHWVGEHGAVVRLGYVYEPPRHLPGIYSTVLDAVSADGFQRAQFEKDAFDTYDTLCGVRVHESSESGGAFGELIFSESCSIEPPSGSETVLLSDVLQAHERRVRCSSVGEAFAAAQLFSVPVLVSVGYLLQSAKTCLDRAMLEGLCGCREEDEECDIALEEFGERLSFWTARGVAAEPSTDEGITSLSGARAVADLLHDVNAFAWFWAVSSGLSSRDEPFEDFLSRFRQVTRPSMFASSEQAA